MHLQRSSGILLHPTALPGPNGIGNLGREAFAFVDFLAAGGQSVWQILPLGPVGYGGSPYSALSAFAGNPLLICLEKIVEAGDLDAKDLADGPLSEERTDYQAVKNFKERLLIKAAGRFREGADPQRQEAFVDFCADHAYWLDEYTLFKALRRQQSGQAWNHWPEEIRQRQPETLAFWRQELAETIFGLRYAQFVFFEQWFALKDHANSKGIRILGDMPIFVSFDSADVWSNPEDFYLDEERRPTLVAGVPPDYFSETGQRWGNPLYRWDRMKERGFSWWRKRLGWSLTQTDLLRIDHFRGFEASWAIPAEEETAINGTWMPVPGEELFQSLISEMGDLPLIAEDLGLITPEVEALRDRFALPGMKVLQFAFDSGPDNPYLPHNLIRDCVVYTGTHDNDTTLGWWRSLSEERRREVCAYLGQDAPSIPWALIHMAMTSVADLCIIPLQDLLELGNEARMNHPGHLEENWSWRFPPGALTENLTRRFGELTRISGRAPESDQPDQSDQFD
jgi:4-alpha-glucanotransferase